MERKCNIVTNVVYPEAFSYTFESHSHKVELNRVYQKKIRLRRLRHLQGVQRLYRRNE